MKLEELGIEKKQREILEKKKILSAEALLRQEPLHYWDFSRLMPLDTKHPETVRLFAKHMPFAITGICVSYREETRNHANLAKLRIQDDRTGNFLYVNIMGVETVKYAFLEDGLAHRLLEPVTIPDGVDRIIQIRVEEIRPACKKKIEEINQLENPPLRMIGGLKTGGKDECSEIRLSEAEIMLGDKTSAFLHEIFKDSSAPYQAMQQCVRWYLRGLRLDLCIKKVRLDSVRLSDLVLNKRLIVGGFIQYNEEYRTYAVMNPIVFSDDIGRYNRYYVQYSSVKGWSHGEHEQFVDQAIERLSDFDIMPPTLLKKAGLPSFRDAAILMHHPKSWDQCRMAIKRAVFDDLVYFAVKLALNQTLDTNAGIAPMQRTEIRDLYLHSLPYQLTDGQACAIQMVSDQMKKGKSVHSLIQGDVGTGKTCVAFALLLQAAENGFQGALAAPYTTLAWQHFQDMEPIAKQYGICAAFLTSETKAAERKKIYAGLQDGSISIVIGTHSIFSKAVEYKNLGLVVLDEEHKFGVVHRGNIMEKGIPHCHQITMSATPIPKSLADMVYGNHTGFITITDKPANRLPVKTAVTSRDEAAAKVMIREIKAGHQAYIVCPAIETNGKTPDIASIERKEAVYRSLFAGTGIRMEVLTGKMKAQEKMEIMKEFASGAIDVLMATTVIEVGMNVPNATVITITGADRFGFSTLHQLRGRVGRGKDQAYCILQTETPNEKLQFLTQTNDGFLIAEKDLELRGPGTLFGERQSGSNYFVDLMLAYPNMFAWIKRETEELCRKETGKDIVRRYEELFLPEEKR